MSKNDAEAVIDILKVHAQQYNETEKTIDILVSIEGLEKVALSFQPNEIRALLPFLKLELNKDNSGDNVELRCTSAKLISDDQGSAKLLFEFPDAHPLPIEVGYGGLRAIRDAINELLEPSAKNDLN